MVVKIPVGTTVTLEGCGGLERTGCGSLSLWERYGSFEKTCFGQFSLWEGTNMCSNIVIAYHSVKNNSYVILIVYIYRSHIRIRFASLFCLASANVGNNVKTLMIEMMS